MKTIGVFFSLIFLSFSFAQYEYITTAPARVTTNTDGESFVVFNKDSIKYLYKTRYVGIPYTTNLAELNGKIYGATDKYFFKYDPGNGNFSFIRQRPGNYNFILLKPYNDKIVTFIFESTMPKYFLLDTMNGNIEFIYQNNNLFLPKDFHIFNDKIYAVENFYPLGGSLPGGIYSIDLQNHTFQVELANNDTIGNKTKGFILHSNGKFYLINRNGGNYNNGLLYEFDPATSQYTILHHFTPDENAATLVEGNNNKLYGFSSISPYNDNMGYIYEYDLNTGQFTTLDSFPTRSYPSYLYNLPVAVAPVFSHNKILGINRGINEGLDFFEYDITTGQLNVTHQTNAFSFTPPLKTAQGDVYIATNRRDNSFEGELVKFNFTTNTWETAASFNKGGFISSIRMHPTGKLYGITRKSGDADRGIFLFRFNWADSSYTNVASLPISEYSTPGRIGISRDGSIYVYQDQALYQYNPYNNNLQYLAQIPVTEYSRYSMFLDDDKIHFFYVQWNNSVFYHIEYDKVSGNTTRTYLDVVYLLNYTYNPRRKKLYGNTEKDGNFILFSYDVNTHYMQILDSIPFSSRNSLRVIGGDKSRQFAYKKEENFPGVIYEIDSLNNLHRIFTFSSALDSMELGTLPHHLVFLNNKIHVSCYNPHPQDSTVYLNSYYMINPDDTTDIQVLTSLKSYPYNGTTFIFPFSYRYIDSTIFIQTKYILRPDTTNANVPTYYYYPTSSVSTVMMYRPGFSTRNEMTYVDYSGTSTNYYPGGYTYFQPMTSGHVALNYSRIQSLTPYYMTLPPVETDNRSGPFIYPNPTKEKLYLKKEADIIEVYDLSGEIIWKNNIKGTKEVQLPSLNPGIYIVRLITPESILATKLIIEK